jgi:hypothetical protein
MKVVQFLNTSMFGSYWVQCEVIGETEEGRTIIRYLDSAASGYHIEEEVDANRLRVVDAAITAKYLTEVATYAATKFKTDLLIMDAHQLSDIALAIEKELMLHFNFPN